MQMNRLESEEFRWAVALPILLTLLLYLYSVCLWPQGFLPIACCHIYLAQRKTAHKEMHTKDTDIPAHGANSSFKRSNAAFPSNISFSACLFISLFSSFLFSFIFNAKLTKPRISKHAENI